MDQRISQEGRQPLLDFKCKKILPGIEKSTAVSPAPVQKLGIIPNENSELKLACQTPEKTNEHLHRFKEGEVKLPDKWVPQWMHVFNFFYIILMTFLVLTSGIFPLFSDIRSYQSSLIV